MVLPEVLMIVLDGYIRYFFEYYFCKMLGLYESKYFVGENEIDYHLRAQKYIYCKYCPFKHTI